jgi:hypothetical protein
MEQSKGAVSSRSEMAAKGCHLAAARHRAFALFH